MNVSLNRQRKTFSILAIFMLLINSILPYSTAFAEGELEEQDLEIYSVKFGEGTKGTPPSFYSDYVEGEIIEDKIVIPLTEEMTEQLSDGKLDPNSLIYFETTEDTKLKINDKEVENFSESFFVADYFNEVNIEYEIIIEKEDVQKKYSLIFKTWEQEIPEILSFTYGEGSLGSPPTFFDYKLDGIVSEDKVIIPIPEEMTDEVLEYGLEFGPNFMDTIFYMELTEDTKVEGIVNGRWGEIDVTGGRFAGGVFEDADVPYKIVLIKDGIEREYTVIFQTVNYVEDEEITVTNVEQFPSLEFEYGVTLEEVKAQLPKQVTLYLSNNEEKKVNVSWDTSSFKENNVTTFTFTGSYELPDGVSGDKPKITITINVTSNLDFSVLAGLIQEAEAKLTQNYTEESLLELENVLNEAKEVFEDYSLTQGEIDAAIENLQDAIKALIPFTDESQFEFDKQTGTITNYLGEGGPVYIPPQIDGVDVKVIGKDSFSFQSTKDTPLLFVEIPETVEVIENGAFFRGGLKEVSLPKGLKVIGKEAFMHNGLTTVDLPETLTEIKSRTFYGNDIENLVIPDNVETIGFQAFYRNKITSLTLSENLKTIGGQAFADNKIEAIKLPSNIESIESLAFSGNPISKMPEIPKTLTSLSGFDNTQITELHVPSTVKNISGFHDTPLETLTIENGVENILELAFRNTKISEIRIPESVKNIRPYAFAGTNLTKKRARVDNYRHNVFMANYAFSFPSPVFEKTELEKLAIYEVQLIEPKTDAILSRSTTNDENKFVIELPKKFTEEQVKSVHERKYLLRFVTSEGALIQEDGDGIPRDWSSLGRLNTIKAGETRNFTAVVYDDIKKEYTVTLKEADLFWDDMLSVLDDAKKLSLRGMTKETKETIRELVAEGEALVTKGNDKVTQAKINELEEQLLDALQNVKTDFLIEGDTIVGYKGNDEYLELPEVWNGQIIRKIGKNAFANHEDNSSSILSSFNLFTSNKKIKKVDIPETITTIEDGAFFGNAIDELEIPNSVTTIGVNAFAHNELTKLTIGYGIKEIKQGAFANNLLEKVEIDSVENVVTIGRDVFINNGKDSNSTIVPSYLRNESDIQTNKSDLEEAITDAKKKLSGNYTEASKLNVQVKLGIAKNILNNELALQEEVDKATSELKLAIEQLTKKYPNTNKTKLEELINELTVIDLSELEKEPAEELKKKLKEAKEIYEDPWSEQADIDTVLKQLKVAKNNLKTEEKFFGTVPINDDEVKITDYRGSNKDVFIPEKIAGKNVTVIGTAAFAFEYEEQRLSHVTLPETLQIIEREAFYNNNLKSIHIPDHVVEIGSQAFRYNELEDVYLSNSLEKVGYESFNSNEIKSINLPESLKELGTRSFADNSISELNIPKGLAEIAEGAFGNNEITELVVPKNIKIVGKNAFASNKLNQLVLEEGIEKVEFLAFGYNELTELVVPSSVEVIGAQAFKENKLTNITFQEGLKRIGSDAFLSNNLTEIVIPETVVEIDGGAFQDNKLNKVTLSNNIQRIGAFAFSGNELTDISLPTSLKVLELSAFSKNKLKKVVIPEGIEEVGSFVFAHNELIEVVIPSTLKVIRNNTFENNQLKTVIIPHGVTEIEYEAFKNNELTSVIISSTVERIGEEAFSKNKLESGSVIILGGKGITIEEGAFNHNGSGGNESIEPTFKENLSDIIEIPTFEEVRVPFGTALEEVKEQLPSEIKVKLSEKNIISIDLEWHADGYDEFKVGEYHFTASYELPFGNDKEKPNVIINIKVKERDDSKLITKIEKFEELNEEDYTIESFEALIQVINDAKKLLNLEKISQQQVDEAVDNIKLRMELLERVPDEPGDQDGSDNGDGTGDQDRNGDEDETGDQNGSGNDDDIGGENGSGDDGDTGDQNGSDNEEKTNGQEGSNGEDKLDDKKETGNKEDTDYEEDTGKGKGTITETTIDNENANRSPNESELDGKVKLTSKNQEGNLPNTSLNYANKMLAGLLILSIGFALYISATYRRRNN